MLHRIGANIARLERPHRLPGIDLARGLAIIGMFAAHLAVIVPLSWSEPRTWGDIVSGRSSILFATLAGVSLALVSSRVAGGRNSASPARWWGLRTQLVLRAALIWALGIYLDGLEVPVYVILPAYGVLFLIGMALLRVSTRGLFTIAAVLALTMPFVVAAIDDAIAASSNRQALEEFWRLFGWHYPFLLWAAFIAAGMGAGRLLAQSTRQAWALLTVGAALAGIGYAIIGPLGNDVDGQHPFDPAPVASEQWFLAVLQDDPHSSGLGEAIGSGGFALAAIGACVLLAATPIRWIVWPLRAAGSMPLTAYVAHILVWAIWIVVELQHGPVEPWEDFRALEPFWPTTFGVLVGCSIWTLIVGRGPLEALLSTLTTGPRRLPRTGRD